VEFAPPRNYLCYLRYDSFIFVSGYTSDLEALENQVPQILKALASGLMIATSDWSHLVKLSFFLHRSQKIEVLKELLEKATPKPDTAKVEFGVVDGYAGEKCLLEVEATAVLLS
jgi:enamine deaminase RidA (YjgF/YER057c/UK114 family)